jgi:hypothetical protein
VFGDVFYAAAQPRREKINCLSRVLCLDLRADGPAIDIEIGLRDDGSPHRRITMRGQSDVGVQHRPAGKPRELTDLVARILGRRRAIRCHLDLDVR